MEWIRALRWVDRFGVLTVTGRLTNTLKLAEVLQFDCVFDGGAVKHFAQDDGALRGWKRTGNGKSKMRGFFASLRMTDGRKE